MHTHPHAAISAPGLSSVQLLHSACHFLWHILCPNSLCNCPLDCLFLLHILPLNNAYNTYWLIILNVIVMGTVGNRFRHRKVYSKISYIFQLIHIFGQNNEWYSLPRRNYAYLNKRLNILILPVQWLKTEIATTLFVLLWELQAKDNLFAVVAVLIE